MATTSAQALNTVLAAYTGLTSLLASYALGIPGIYDTEAPQGALTPMLVFQLIAAQPQTSHGEGTDARLDGAHFQLTALDATPLKCAQILYQARLAIETAASLKGIQTDERVLARSENAQCHAHAADFQIWNNPDV